MARIQIKRGTRSQLNSAASNNQLHQGEPYLVTDENRLSIGVSNNTVKNVLMESDFENMHIRLNENFNGVRPLCPLISHIDLMNGSSGALNANVIGFLPFWFNRKITIARLFVRVYVAVNPSGLNVGIYNTQFIDQILRKYYDCPYQRLWSSTIDTSSSGWQSVSCNFTVEANQLYWIAGASNLSSTTLGVNHIVKDFNNSVNIVYYKTFLGWDSSGTDKLSGYTLWNANGVLPDTITHIEVSASYRIPIIFFTEKNPS